MPRETMDREIRQLKEDVLALGEMVEKQISAAMTALKTRNQAMAGRILKTDQSINQKRFDIETSTLLVIATQQPMAHDLRLLAAVLEVAGELERIGDYAKGNAKITQLLGAAELDAPVHELEQMSQAAGSMLHRAVIAFVKEDEHAAREIPREDDRIDAMYQDIYHKLVECMIRKPATIDHTNYFMWAAHNLERTADRVSNICERTLFVVTGEMTEVTSNDEDMS